MSDAPDLSLVETVHLIEALMNRHDAILIVRQQERVKGKTQTLFDYEGGLSNALGLAEYAKAGLLDRQFNPEKYEDEESDDTTAG